MLDKNSLAQTTWKCKYHIVFTPKYGRQNIYGKYKQSIEKILRELCERKGVTIQEANVCRVIFQDVELICNMQSNFFQYVESIRNMQSYSPRR